MITPFSLRPRTALSLALSALAVACGSTASGGAHGASVGGGSGVGGSATGGSSSSGGRAAGSGGNTPLSGGAAGNGGSAGASDASGGTPASGGSSSMGAVSGGGASAVGGAFVSGGAPPVGGAFAAGGASAAGGAATGGMSGGALSYALLTNRNDNVRSGVNLSESILTPAAVGGGHFGLLFSRTVDAQIYGQPLYMSGLAMPDGMSHNVVFVTTSHDSIYAFDADHAELKAPLWQKSLGTAGPTSSFGCTDMTPEVGISSTPVIDSTAGNLYVVSKGQEGTNWVQRLHVLDVKTGNERPGSPISITASVTGTGDGSSGGKVTFDPQTHLNRAGLLLEGGVVYLTFASHCDSGAYHGWVLGYTYDGTTLTQTRVFNVSVNGSKGGIWQAGVGLSTDGESLYFAAGNGSTNPNSTPPDLSESVVRLGLSDFKVRDYWTPTGFSALNAADADLSSGAVLLPYNLLFTGSKDGQIYLLDRTNLGKYSAGGDAILQKLTTPGKTAGDRGHLHGGPIYYKDPASSSEWILVWPESSPLMRFSLNATTHRLENPITSPIATPGHPGAILTLSANGTQPGTATLWASMASGSNEDGAWHMAVPGTLYAVDPTTNPPRVLWSSDHDMARDAVGNVSKFNPATVANGHVYLATFSGALQVYGLLN